METRKSSRIQKKNIDKEKINERKNDRNKCAKNLGSLLIDSAKSTFGTYSYDQTFKNFR